MFYFEYRLVIIVYSIKIITVQSFNFFAELFLSILLIMYVRYIF